MPLIANANWSQWHDSVAQSQYAVNDRHVPAAGMLHLHTVDVFKV
jgi:hypothetical protein